MEIKRKLNQGKSYITYIPKIKSDLRFSQEDYKKIWDLKPSELGKIKLFGKLIDTPRWFQSYGNNYNFSGIDHDSEPVPEILQPLLHWVNQKEPDFEYNGILVNWYQDGSHYIGPHSDDEKDLVKDSPIYAFSFGTSRNFNIISKNKDIDEKYKFSLENNSLIVMGGECQKFYKHSISKSTRISDSRISVTIRAFN
jgi:alkylated DNA repair dioxygenase AlkB